MTRCCVAQEGSGVGSRQSEADSEEAIAELIALSQEGSLGSLSDGEPGYARASRCRPPPRALETCP